MTQKSFNFARKFSLPLYFVSAADGTNVVKVMGIYQSNSVTGLEESGSSHRVAGKEKDERTGPVGREGVMAWT